MQLDGQAGHVADNPLELLLGNVARKGNRVKARAAHCRVREQRVNRDAAFAPAPRQDGIFEDGQHQAGIARTLDREAAQDFGDETGGGYRAA